MAGADRRPERRVARGRTTPCRQGQGGRRVPTWTYPIVAYSLSRGSRGSTGRERRAARKEVRAALGWQAEACPTHALQPPGNGQTPSPSFARMDNPEPYATHTVPPPSSEAAVGGAAARSFGASTASGTASPSPGARNKLESMPCWRVYKS